MSLRSYQIPSVVTLLLSVLILVTPGCTRHEPIEVTAPTNREAIERGRELVTGIAACGFCHGETASPNALLSGGRAIIDSYGEVSAPNLTPHATGLKGWGAVDVVQAIRSGVNKEGERLSPDAHKGYAWMSDTDVYGIVAYLQTMPPIQNQVERRESGTFDGMFEKDRTMTGYVPDIPETG
jgi:cytochrome c553